MKKILEIVVLSLLLSGGVVLAIFDYHSTPKITTIEYNANFKIVSLLCIFQNAYDGDNLIKPNNKMYGSLSKNTSISLDYANKAIHFDTPLWSENRYDYPLWDSNLYDLHWWSENEIIGKLSITLEGETKLNNIITFNPSSGKLKQEIIEKNKTTTINFNCSNDI